MAGTLKNLISKAKLYILKTYHSVHETINLPFISLRFHIPCKLLFVDIILNHVDIKQRSLQNIHKASV